MGSSVNMENFTPSTRIPIKWLMLCMLMSMCVKVSGGLPVEELDSQIPGHYLNSFLIEVDSPDTAQTVADEHGFTLIEKLPHLDIYLLEHLEIPGRSKRSADDVVTRLLRDSRVKFAEQQVTLKRVKRRIVHDKQLEFPIREIKNKSLFYRNTEKFDARDGLPPRFNDQYFGDQWYLINKGQTGGEEGVDLNVLPAWENGFDGRGVVITTLDDGIDHEHPDITNNYDKRASADFNDKKDKENDPTPDKSSRGNSHGTRCAGEIAAEANNGICGVGIAHKAHIGGIRILDGPITDELEARALLYQNDYIDIYSASWGPHDDGATMEAPKRACADALRAGVTKGRDGKGSLFVWATGNGGSNDMCGADGYVSSIESISVQSLTDHGDIPFFGERCASTMIAVPTGGEATQTEEIKAQYKIKVVTTDLDGGCVENFEGTSSAAPLAAGCYALVLQANPELTWRDVQYITAQSARIPIVDESWTLNGAGYHVNSKFGFGIMDCSAMVELAQSWKSVPEQHICEGDVVKLEREISHDSCVKHKFTFDGCQNDRSRSITNLEHVQLIVKASSQRRGNVEIALQSPDGTRSELLTHRAPDNSKEDIDFTFMTVHNWGENPAGEWLVEVCDNPGKTGVNNNTIQLHSFALRAYGYHDDKVKPNKKSLKPTSAELLKLQKEEFTSSRELHLKRSQDPVSNDNGKNKLDDFANSADKLLAEIGHLFESRSLGDNYNNNRNSDLFGKRGYIQDENKNSDISQVKQEISKILVDMENRKYGSSYIEEYLEHRRELERKRKLEQLIQYISEILDETEK